MVTMEDVVAEPVLTQAFAWLCRQRQAYPPAADVWAFRRHWPEAREPLRAALLAGEYAISLLTRVTNARGEECDLWAARDALVLKALALVLRDRLPASPSCSHLAGHGGATGAVRTVWKHLPRHRCVLKTDVQGL